MKLLMSLTLALSASSGEAVDTPGSSGFVPAAVPGPVVDADYYENGAPSEVKFELGRRLFFDKVLSGNRNISCATCHHPRFGTGDGVSLALGEGATQLGPERRAGGDPERAVHERVPRNAPALFNLGAREFTRMFHDGRVETDPQGYYEGGFITPARFKLPVGLENVLAAQAMFPPTSPTEMAGQQGENELADARSANHMAGQDGLWDRIGRRLQDIPEYVEAFQAAFPEQVQGREDVSYVLAANAIAAFESRAFRADDSAFDRHLRGEEQLAAGAERGMQLFYGKAGCYTCHSGKFQTDQQFHAIAMPQVGPGKADGFDSGYWSTTGFKDFLEDFGRGRVTARAEDHYRFRTPSLRNVALTGPWGHDGAYASLEEVVRHHLDPLGALEAYEVDLEVLPPLEDVVEFGVIGSRLRRRTMDRQRLEKFLARDGWVQSNDTLRGRIAAANELAPVDLTEREIADLLAFLESLTDAASRDLTALVPESVPSGLPVED